MLNISDIRKILLLSHLNEDMLQQVLDITKVEKYKTGEYIFRTNDFSDTLYAVAEGKIVLELEKNSEEVLRILDINVNYMFGVTSMIEAESRTRLTNAKVVQDSIVYAWNALELEKLFHYDTEMGYIFMKRIAKILKTRLHNRDAQIANLYT